MVTPKGYDSSCYDLAKLFVDDTPSLEGRAVDCTAELAHRIQDTIEDYLQEQEGACPRCGSHKMDRRGDIEWCADCDLGHPGLRNSVLGPIE